MPEVSTMVHFSEMGKFVGNHVINDHRRKVYQSPIKHNVTVARARPPTRAGRRESPFGDAEAGLIQKVLEPAVKPRLGLTLQPGLRHFPDTRVISISGQR